MLDPRVVTLIALKLGLKVWPSFIAACCCTAKVILILGGWRGGKSARVAFIIFIRIYLKWLREPLPLDAQGLAVGSHLIWLVGPDYEDARPEYFYLAQWSKQLGLQVEVVTDQPFVLVKKVVVLQMDSSGIGKWMRRVAILFPIHLGMGTMVRRKGELV